MDDVMRETVFGQLVRALTRNRYSQYAEEKDDSQLPVQYYSCLNSSSTRLEDILEELTNSCSSTTVPNQLLDNPLARFKTTQASTPGFSSSSYESVSSDDALEKAITQGESYSRNTPHVALIRTRSSA